MLMNRKQRQHGFEIVTDPMLGNEAHDNFTCAHCCINVRVKPLKFNGNVATDENVGTIYDRCNCCDKFICIACMEKPNCVTIEQRLQFWEGIRSCTT